jgi:hypothetical protein
MENGKEEIFLSICFIKEKEIEFIILSMACK